MTGPLIEVLDHGSDDSAGGRRSGWPMARVALLVAALMVGGAVGAGAVRLFDRPPAKAAAPVQGRIDAVVIMPAGGDVTSSSSAGGTVSDVDVAIINEGSVSLNSVVAQWQGLQAGEVGAEPSVAPVGRLVPGAPTTVRLRLWRPCTAAASAAVLPPALLLTWTLNGAPQRLVVAPFGLDRLWAALPASCPGSGPVNALDVSLSKAVPVGARGVALSVDFENLGEVNLTVRTPTLSGGFTEVRVTRPRFVVPPHTASEVAITVRVTDCKAAIERQYAAGLTYRVSSQGAGPVSPTFTSDQLSQALGDLVYRACGQR